MLRNNSVVLLCVRSKEIPRLVSLLVVRSAIAAPTDIPHHVVPQPARWIIGTVDVSCDDSSELTAPFEQVRGSTGLHPSAPPPCL